MPISAITNFLLFQLGWFACVLGGAYDQAVPGSVIAIFIIAFHIYRAAETMKEIKLLMLALIIGFAFESIVTLQGLAQYRHGQSLTAIAPFWMILMWPLFATTLNHSMRWLKKLTPLLTAVIGAIFAPLAYYAGNRLGAVSYDNIMLSMSVIAGAWALLLPSLVMVSLKIDGYKASAIRPATGGYSDHV